MLALSVGGRSTAWILVLLFLCACSMVSAQEGCVSTSNELNAREAQVTDLSVVREYVLCDNALLQPGALGSFDTLVTGGMDLIHLRPNLHVKCGSSGSRLNACRINAGTVQVEGTTALAVAPTGEVLDNVILEGLTFSSASQSMIWITKPGNIIFRDCEFRENTAISPILLDYYDPLAPTSELSVTFDRCSFVDNMFVYGSQGTLVIGNSRQNRLTITDCQFTRNNMIYNNTNQARSSSLIETSGPIEVTRSCFEDNLAGVAPIVVYTAELTASSNFQYLTRGTLCPLAAVFSTSAAYSTFTPTCTDFDATTCVVGGNPVPAASPSSPAAAAPTVNETNTAGNTTNAPVESTNSTNTTAPPPPLPVTATSAPMAANVTFSPGPTVFVPSPSPSMFPSEGALIVRDTVVPTKTPIAAPTKAPVAAASNVSSAAPSALEVSSNIQTPIQANASRPRAPSSSPVLALDRNEASDARTSLGSHGWLLLVPAMTVWMSRLL